MRLPNGFGSVYKLSGKRRRPWVARKTMGYDFDEEKGKAYPIYKFIGYYATKQEAMTALVDYNRDPYDFQVDSMTFAELYDRWSDVHFPKVSDSGVKGYKAAFLLCTTIKDMRVRDIKLLHLQKVVDDSGKNTPTLKKLKILLGLMYDFAVMNEILPHDKREMIRYLDISKAGNPNSRKRQIFSTAEVDKLWSVRDGNPYVSVALMLIYTGVRIGELLDLKKKDVFLEEKWFSVCKSKTEAGIREVPIADKILPFFRHWMDQDSLEGFLITTPEGGRMVYRNYYDSYWKPIMDAIGANHRPHDTRHTCISMMTAAGVEKIIIQKIVGHKGQDVTEAVYTHLELPIKLEAINKI